MRVFTTLGCVIARFHCISRYSFFFSDEEYDTDVSKSFTQGTAANGDPTFTPKNGCARRCQMITGKKKVTVRLQLFSPLSSFSSLVPSNVAMGIKVFLTSSKHYSQIMPSCTIYSYYLIIRFNHLFIILCFRREVLHNIQNDRKTSVYHYRRSDVLQRLFTQRAGVSTYSCQIE